VSGLFNKIKSLKLTDYIFFGFFIFNIAFIIWFIFIGSIPLFNSDTAVQNVLAREQLLTGQFFPSGWIYNQDLWVTFVNVPMVLLSFLIDNQLLLRSTAVFLQTIILFVIFYILGKKVFGLKCFLIYTSVGFSAVSLLYLEWMFAQAVYGHSLIIVLLFFMFSSYSVNESFELNYRFYIPLFILTAITFIGGTRYLGILLLPAVGAFVFVYYIDNIKESFPVVFKHFKRFILWCVLLIIPVVIGYSIHHYVISSRLFLSDFTNPVLRSGVDVDLYRNSFDIFIQGLFMHFGVDRQQILFSINGVVNAISYFAAIAFSMVFPILLTIKFKEENLHIKRLIVFTWLSLAISAFLWFFTNGLAVNYNSFRYFIVTIVLHLILSVYYIYKYLITKGTFLVRFLGIMILVVFLSTLLFRGASFIRNDTSEATLGVSNELKSSLLERNLNMGYATFWNANRNSAMFNFDIEVAAVYPDFRSPYYILTSTRFFETDYYVGSTFLLLTEQEYHLFQNDDILQEVYGAPEEIYGLNGMMVVVYDYNISSRFIR